MCSNLGSSLLPNCQSSVLHLLGSKTDTKLRDLLLFRSPAFHSHAYQNCICLSQMRPFFMKPFSSPWLDVLCFSAPAVLCKDPYNLVLCIPFIILQPAGLLWVPLIHQALSSFRIFVLAVS